MDKKFLTLFRVVEFRLNDSEPNVFACVEDILRSIVFSENLVKAVVIDSRFLMNKKNYNFRNSYSKSFSKEWIGLKFSAIVSSCVDKGHLSCLFVINEVLNYSSFTGYKKTSSEVNLFSQEEGLSPLSKQQVDNFVACLESLYEEGNKFCICFTHDAEFLYLLEMPD